MRRAIDDPKTRQVPAVAMTANACDLAAPAACGAAAPYRARGAHACGTRRPLRAAGLALVLLAGAAATPAAPPLALPPAPQAAFAPKPGTQLPLAARFTGDDGRPLRLGSLFGAAPVVLVPGYYTCPNLCSTLFEGVLQALALSGLAGDAYRLVGFSIDPADTAARALGRKRAYAAILPPGAGLYLLSAAPGAPADVAALADAIGYRASRDADGQFAHAAGFVVATGDGRIAAAFSGVRFDPAALRAAVEAARLERIGSAAIRGGGADAGNAAAAGRVAANAAGTADAAGPGLAQRFLMLCSHYAPASGLHSAGALWAVRVGVLLALAALLAWAWRRRPQGARP